MVRPYFKKGKEKWMPNGTFLRFTEGWLHLLEPANLGVDGAGVPNALVDAMGLEEVVFQRRSAGDGEVGPLLEVCAMRLRRWRQGQPEMLSCKIDQSFPSLKTKLFTHHIILRRAVLAIALNKRHIRIHNLAILTKRDMSSPQSTEICCNSNHHKFLSVTFLLCFTFPKRKNKRTPLIHINTALWYSRMEAALVHCSKAATVFYHSNLSSFQKGEKAGPFFNTRLALHH